MNKLMIANLAISIITLILTLIMFIRMELKKAKEGYQVDISGGFPKPCDCANTCQ